MATVANQLTRIHDAEGTLTTANWPSGGGTGGANTDIFLQGSQSLGKRQTTTGTAAGFILEDAANNNCSAADVHVGLWFWVTQYAILDDVKLGFASNTGSPTNFDSHNFDFANEYPSLGGWVRAWVDISRTPDATGGTGLDEAALRTYGIQVSFTTSPGGTSPNVILDAADFTDGTAALDLTGTSGVWSDFSTADANTTNQYGVFRLINGVYFCYARVQLGTSGSSLVFNDSNFTIIFPNQSLVATTFMGVTVDLGNASTNIDWTNGVIRSAGAKKGDLQVTGTSGAFDTSGMTFLALREVVLTSVCNIVGGSFIECGLITAGGADLVGVNIVRSTATSAISVANLSQIDECVFTSDGTGHAVNLGTISSSITMTWNCTDSGYAGTNGSTGNETILVNVASSQTLTINVSDGATTPTYYNTGAGSVSVVSGQATLTITVVDVITGDPIQNARVYVTAAAGGGMTVGDVIIDKVLTDVDGEASDTRSYGSNQPITGRVRKSSASPYYKESPIAGTVNSSSGLALTIQMIPDE
jgi:hypothetical protein